MPYQKGEGKTVVIALGGNALGNTPQEQLELVKNTAAHIVDMIEDGTNVVVSHGNGPQVGMINNAFAYASANDGKTPEMPFPEAGAMSQGYIGYQLSQAILNELKARGILRSTVNVITQTVVDPDDPAFQNPTKPVGAFLTEEEARAKAAETGWTFKEDAGRGWRQVVASPKPVRVVEFDAISDLVDAGYVVVSTGGGGVPVFEEGGYAGVPAVIDKDRSSALLARELGVDMIEDGTNVVVSHGNGPQVGMINNAFAYASANDGKTPEMPFPEAGAMSQGYIGYQLSQAILNELKARGILRSTVNVITQTVVDPDDPAFQNPTKPVGAFLTEEEARAKAAETGWTFKEDAGRGWRQVVASPKPVRVVEFDAISDLVDAGYVVVSTGGGGVPVFEEGGYAGVPAVIDKDRSSALLARELGADMLVILTAVEKVCVNFNTPEQAEIDGMDVAQARAYIEEGQFAPGSMLPKVEACIEYVEQFPAGKALITSLECAAAGLRGETGTVITA